MSAPKSRAVARAGREADRLLSDLRSDDPARQRTAAARMLRHPALRGRTAEQVIADRQRTRRKHALHVIALEHGAADWNSLTAMLEAEEAAGPVNSPSAFDVDEYLSLPLGEARAVYRRSHFIHAGGWNARLIDPSHRMVAERYDDSGLSSGRCANCRRWSGNRQLYEPCPGAGSGTGATEPAGARSDEASVTYDFNAWLWEAAEIADAIVGARVVEHTAFRNGLTRDDRANELQESLQDEFGWPEGGEDVMMDHTPGHLEVTISGSTEVLAAVNGRLARKLNDTVTLVE